METEADTNNTPPSKELPGGAKGPYVSKSSDNMDAMAALIQSAVDPILQINEEGIIQLVNKACLNTFLYNEEDLIGKNVKMLMPESYAAKHDEYLHRYKVTRQKRVLGKGRKLQGLKSDGCVFPMFLSLSEAIIEEKTVFTGIVRDLSAEEQEQERMLSILTSAVDPIVQIDEQGIIQLVNPACCKIFMYQESELVGQNVKILMPEEHASQHDSYLRNYITTGVKKVLGVGRKLRGLRSDGNTFSLYLTLSEARIGKRVFFTGIMRDLSAEEEEHERMLSILKVTHYPIVQINEQGIIQLVNSACCKAFMYQENELVGQNVKILMPEEHASQHDSYLKNYATTGVKKVMGIGRQLRARRSDGSAFSIYLTLSEARIGKRAFYVGHMRDLSAEEQEQERMMSILSSAVDPIVQINEQGIIQMVNNACCQVFKYQDVDLVGQNVKILMPEEHASQHDSYLENYVTTGIKKVLGIGRKLRGRKSDGSTFSLFLSLSEARIGSRIFFTGILRDLSAQEEENDRMMSILTSAVDPIVQITSDGTIQLVNPACCKVFRYEEVELVGKNVKILMPEEHASKHDSYLSNYIQTGVKKVLGVGRKLRGRKSDGSMFGLYLTLSEARIGSRIFFTGIMRDLSAEEAENERMLAILTSAVDPIVQITKDGIIQLVNAACCKVFMYEESELVGQNVKILMPAEHANQHDSYLQNYITTGVKKVLGIGRKLRGRRSDGSTFSLYLTLSEAKINQDIFFTGILRDLSAEEQENERMLEILTSAVDPIVQIDERGIIQLVNPACCNVFQYQESELVGQNVKMLMPAEHANIHDSYLKNYLTTGVKKVLGIGRKLRGLRSDGNTFSLYLTLSEARIGKRVFFTGIMRDLSAEEEEHERMLSILKVTHYPIVQINEQGIIQLVNSACCKAFMYQENELVGQNVKILMPEEHASQHDSYLKNYATTGVKKVMGIGRQLRARRSDGSAFSIYLTLSEARIGKRAFYVGHMRDLSAEEQEQERMMSILSSAVDPIVQINEQGIIQMVNNACCQVFKYQDVDLVGQNVKILMPEEHASQHDSYLENYVTTGIKKVLGIGRKLRGRKSDGSTFSLFLSLSEARIGSRIFFTGILRDLSAQEEENDRMMSILTSAVDPIVQITSDGTIQLVNPACCKVFRYEEVELVGKNVKILMPEEHASKHDSYLSNYIQTGVKKVLGVGRKLRGRKSDGSMFGLYLTLSEARIGSRIFFTGIMRDLSAEEAENERMLAILTSAVDPIVQITKDGIIQLVNAACCKVFMYEESELVGQNVKILMPAEHANQHDSYLQNYITTGVKKVLGIGRKLRGRRSDGSTFSLYLTLSEAKINQDIFFTGILRDLSAEEQENERMLAILTSAVDPIVQIDERGIIQLVNPACCNVFQYQESELVGQNVKMLMPAEHANIHDSYLKNYLTTGVKKVLGIGRKLRGLRKDGSMFALYLTLSEAKIDNRTLFTGIMRDLSAEEQEQERMMSILSSAVDPIVQINQKGIIQMVNPACCRVFKYEKEELHKQNVKILMPAKYAKNHDDYLNNYVTTGVKKVLGVGRKLRGQRSDGSTFRLYLSLSEAKIGNESFFTGILRDLSAEEDENERMLAILKSAVDPIVQISKTGIIQLVNPACCKVFKYSESDLLGKNVKMLMPEEHACMHDSYLKNYITTGVRKVLGVGRKLKGRRSDGSTFSLYLTLSEAKINDETFFTGIMRDLSVEEEEREALELLINSATDPIVVIDSIGVIERVNPACSLVFGYTKEELLGRNVTMLMPKKHAVQHGRYLERYFERKENKSASTVVGKGRDLEGRKKDGSLFPVFLTVSECVLASKNKTVFIGILRDMTEKEKAIAAEVEREKSEALLMNILPATIAMRLKNINDDTHIADYFESVTILFADVVGFTEYSSTRSPVEVVNFLNLVFKGFDRLADKYGLEKIKTIGDAYMVVSGLQMEKEHTLIMLNFALEMMDQIKQMNESNQHDHTISIRVGINSGSVVAGVVGTKKRFFDLWGDSVNVSSRMESNGIENCIQCTEETAMVAKKYPNEFAVVDRGLIDVKGKGEMKVFLIGKAESEGSMREMLHRHSRLHKRNSMILYQKMSEEFSPKPKEYLEEPALDPLKPTRRALIFATIGLIVGITWTSAVADFWSRYG